MPRSLLILFCLLFTHLATAQSTDTLVTDDDLFNTFSNTALSVEAPGLLGNDQISTSDSLRLMVVSGPANGTLELSADGSFSYTPNEGFTGIDEFTYLLETLPLQHLEVDTTETLLELDLEGIILSLVRADSVDVRLAGTASLYLDPVVNPPQSVQLYGLSMSNLDSLELELDYGAVVGRLSALAEPDSLQIHLSEAGMPTTVSNGEFTQADNKLAANGAVGLDATGLLGTQLPGDSFTFETETPALAIEGALSIDSDVVTVTVPIALNDTVTVSENTADVVINLEGVVVGRGPLRMPAQSNIGTVAITVDPQTSTGIADELPLAFGLSQNYPNPFNPVTTISYSIDVSEQVSLKVFDTLGREVATLVDGVSAAGRYEVQFDAGQLPSGMYLYRLESGDKVEIRKMLLLK